MCACLFLSEISKILTCVWVLCSAEETPFIISDFSLPLLSRHPYMYIEMQILLRNTIVRLPHLPKNMEKESGMEESRRAEMELKSQKLQESVWTG